MVNIIYASPAITAFHTSGRASTASRHKFHSQLQNRHTRVLRQRVWALHRTTTVNSPPKHIAAAAATSRPTSTSCAAMGRSE